MGSCKRYPVTETKAAQDWCGEFVAKQILNLPVVSVEEVLDTFPTIKRKPGRPAKEES